MEWIILLILIIFLFKNFSNRITFGKYKGKKFSELPVDYLHWLANNVDRVKDKALNELEKRKKFHNDNNAVFGIIEAKRKCWKCKKNTRVISLRFYKSYDSIEVYNKQIDVHNEKKLPSDVLKIIQEKYPFYKSKYSHTLQSRYIANTCENCSSLQGDFYLYEEPDGIFFNIYQLEPKYFIGLKNGKLEYIN
jgi:hypothetical protein